MLAVIIFMMLVYRESLKESCLSYEKLMNEFKKICNRGQKGSFFRNLFLKYYKDFRYILQIKEKGVV